MAAKLEIYKCEMCGNIVEVLHGGAGELVCCGKPMVLLQAKTADQGKEKHVPVIEKIDGGYKVKVGDV
ncbi:MAG: desulfoferrodoxin FeS4 iron-binding domain-containing protein, partial [Sedimentisphaerales bacterium]|nr:desulfoferrodoxin FeS4 iron-binding domain-containing protein [Sedimentisphaerales bacterium]